MAKVIAPMVYTKYLHPFSTGNLPPRKAHPTKAATNWPAGHHILSKVRSPPFAVGKNSRKRAPSTGRLPPTPNPRAAKIEEVPIQLGPAPAAIPKAPAMKRVRLKASLRPMISEATPQKLAPRQRPAVKAQVVYLTCASEMSNSAWSDGRHSATPSIQRLNIHVNTTLKSNHN